MIEPHGAEIHGARGRIALESPAPPRGIGLGVGFDWALAAEFIALTVAGVAGIHARGTGGRVAGPAILSFVVVIVLTFLWGEGLRRGERWAWLLQIAANGVGSVGGVVSIPGTVAAVQAGNPWPLVPTLVLVLVSPLIVWRLTRPATRAWVARGDRAEARRRHGGAWLGYLAVWSAAGGVLVACSVLYG